LYWPGVGEEIPADWAVDANGDACTDPRLARAVRPMAGAKGYGLALIVDALSALLSGAAFGVHVRRMYDDFSASQRISHVTLALDPGRFVPVAEFKTRMSEMVAELRATPPAEGFDEIMAPGDVEARTERERRGDGIPLSDALTEDLREVGAKYGLAL
jgi:ureidoglycolate dehydrogenase (NAD+)